MARRSERAFTMLELIIAMVLTAMLLAGAGTIMMRSFSQSAKSQQQRKAMQQMRATMAQVGNDVRVARAPDRDPRYVGNSNDLGKALLANQELTLKLPGGATRTLDVRDVVQASAQSVTFRADVDSRFAGAECVRYYVEPMTRQFRRQVLTFDEGPPPRCLLKPVLKETVLVEGTR